MRIKLTNARSRVTTQSDLHSGGGYRNFILICNLDSGLMKSPKHREIISLVFTCLCINRVKCNLT